MKKKIRALFVLILALMLCVSVIPVAADDGANIATFILRDELVYSRVEIVNGAVTLLKAPASIAGFCGWTAVINGETVFLPAGATCTGITGDVTFRPVTVSYATDTGCSVRLLDDQVGLRFTSTIKTADYEKIAALAGGTDKIRFGTYIVPSRYVTDAQGNFTLEALAAKGYDKYIDVPSIGFYKTNETDSTVAGSVYNIRKGNYTMEYSGRGYMKITYTDGSVGTVYSAYNQTNNSRSILKTVLTAYNERSESYDNLVMEPTGSTHSPYTNTELSMLRAFLDKVVLVGHDMQYNYFILKTPYYVSPWSITFSTDDYGTSKIFAEPPSGMAPEDAMGVYLDGKVIPLSKTAIKDGKVVFEHSSYVWVP